MAKVFNRPQGGRGWTIEKVMARNSQTRAGIEDITETVGRVAKRVLAAHRDQGHARIYTEQHDVDGYIVLDDERGLNAALSIEYGRKGNPVIDPDTGETRHRGGSDGVAPLRIALGSLTGRAVPKRKG